MIDCIISSLASIVCDTISLLIIDKRLSKVVILPRFYAVYIRYWFPKFVWFPKHKHSTIIKLPKSENQIWSVDGLFSS